jgi:hypothetical protein
LQPAILALALVSTLMLLGTVTLAVLWIAGTFGEAPSASASSPARAAPPRAAAPASPPSVSTASPAPSPIQPPARVGRGKGKHNR